MKIEIKITNDIGAVQRYNISGCFVPNNDESPKNVGYYFVIYSDHVHGAEYFNGNYWEVKYEHPVEYWLLS